MPVSTPARLSPRERWLIGGVLSLTAALVVAVVIAVAGSGHRTGHGCIDFTIPYSVGGQEFYSCGAAARRTCAMVGHPGGFVGRAAGIVSRQCRIAGLPVGTAQ